LHRKLAAHGLAHTPSSCIDIMSQKERPRTVRIDAAETDICFKLVNRSSLAGLLHRIGQFGGNRTTEEAVQLANRPEGDPMRSFLEDLRRAKTET
jgi:hypothetical protein